MDKDKTNKTGKAQYMGATRNADPLVSPLGGLAQCLFLRWHILGEQTPDMTSRSTWYDLKLLRGGNGTSTTDPTTAISFSAQYDAIINIFDQCGMSSTKKTHAMRGCGARQAELHGVSEKQVLIPICLTFSVLSNRFINCSGGLEGYGRRLDVCLPIKTAKKFMRTMAGFPSSGYGYFLPREHIKPSVALQKKLFPWIEGAEEQMKGGKGKRPAREADLACLDHLELVKTSREVLLQDLAILRDRVPDMIFFSHPIFCGQDFLEFSEQVQHGITNMEAPREVLFDRLLPSLSEAFYSRSELILEVQRQSQATVMKQLGQINGNLNALLTGQV